MALLILTIFISSTSISGLTKGLNSVGDLSKMDSDLVEYFSTNSSIEVIVQFKTPMDEMKWDAIDQIGLETLGLRMDRHCENAQKIAEYLESHPKVLWVNYAGLKSSPYNEISQKITNGKASGILSFGIAGGLEAGTRFIDALNMILRLVNIGDAKSLACHPASTTHRQLNDEELANAGVSRDLIRLSVGIENIDDIIADVSQALDKA